MFYEISLYDMSFLLNVFTKIVDFLFVYKVTVI